MQKTILGLEGRTYTVSWPCHLIPQWTTIIKFYEHNFAAYTVVGLTVACW